MLDENDHQPYDSYDDDVPQPQRPLDLDLTEEDENAEDDPGRPPEKEAPGPDISPSGFGIFDPWAGHVAPLCVQITHRRGSAVHTTTNSNQLDRGTRRD